MEDVVLNERLEAISNELIVLCIKKGLTVSDMNNIAMIFPKAVRKKICAFENETAFTLNFAQDD